MPPLRLDGAVRPLNVGTASDLPVFEDAQPRSLVVALQPLRPRGRRVGVAAIAWAVGLGSLAGVGVVAQDPNGDAVGPVAFQASEAPMAHPTQLPSTYMGAMLRRDAVTLDSPAPARVEVTTPEVVVSGSVLVRAARVEIYLEARGNRVLDHASVDVSDLNGGIRPAYHPPFRASFDLPFPRPNGTMWVVVTAYDERGMPLGGTRRPFAVGPLLEPLTALADSNPMSERWRTQPADVRAVVAAPAPTCMPLAPIPASSC